jgi:hypothetical protein
MLRIASVTWLFAWDEDLWFRSKVLRRLFTASNAANQSAVSSGPTALNRTNCGWF